MGMNANEVSKWLRQMAGKRDHREAMRDDYLVTAAGAEFRLVHGNPAAAQPTPAAPEPDQADDDGTKITPHRQFSP